MIFFDTLSNWLDFDSRLIPSLDSKNFRIERYLDYHFRSLLIIDPNLTRQNKLVELIFNSLQPKSTFVPHSRISYNTIVRLTQENIVRSEIAYSGTPVHFNPPQEIAHTGKYLDFAIKNFRTLIKINPYLAQVKIREKSCFTTIIEVETVESTEIIDVSAEILIIIDANKVAQQELVKILENLNDNFKQFKYAKLLVCVDDPQVVQNVVNDVQDVLIGNHQEIDYQNSLKELFDVQQKNLLNKLFNHFQKDYAIIFKRNK